MEPGFGVPSFIRDTQADENNGKFASKSNESYNASARENGGSDNASASKDDENDSTFASKDEENDSKFAKEAVLFLFQNSVNGVVPLCASVAELLKVKARLTKKILSLTEQLENLKYCWRVKIGVPVDLVHDSTMPSSIQDRLKIYHEAISKPMGFDQRLKRKRGNGLNKNPIVGCLCNVCSVSVCTYNAVKPPLKLGDKILIPGEITGTVKYVGHLDFVDEHEIFVGVKLDVKVGESDGTKNGKTYFTSPYHYGLFIPLLEVLCKIK